jgi:hypothetical protein
MKQDRRHFRAVATLILSGMAGLARLVHAQEAETVEDIFPVKARREFSSGFRIEQGSEAKAVAYYEMLGESLSFDDDRVPSDLDALLGYMGYEALRARDVDQLAPAELMDYHGLRERYEGQGEFSADEPPADWDVVAAGYFAPKTSDVSGLSKKISWRKVVRLRPRPGSPALKDAVDAMYFLSVLYVSPEELAQGNPFKIPTVNLQIMLVRDPEHMEGDFRDSACWLVYDPSRDYASTYATTTSWDSADPRLVEQKGLRPYYVPDACTNCHGGGRPTGTPHFFDTDYAIDRAMPGDDFFETVGRSGHSPLFESGLNPNTEQYQQALAAFRTLNVEIHRHNRVVDPTSLQTRGAENWIQLHGPSGSAMHRWPIERGWPGDEHEWEEGRLVDRNLLPLLNRYCYRCHGTVSYNVYDRAAVVGKLETVLDYVDTAYMPRDRELSEEDKAELLKWLRMLRDENPVDENP